jgi:hypothetical protein
MILGARFATVRRVWSDEITAPFGANAATVHNDVARHADHARSASNHPDQASMDLLQDTGRGPRNQAATQSGTRDTIRSGSKHSPLHTLAQKEMKGRNDVFGGAWRMTETVRQRHDLVNQLGNQINRRNGRCP